MTQSVDGCTDHVPRDALHGCLELLACFIRIQAVDAELRKNRIFQIFLHKPCIFIISLFLQDLKLCAEVSAEVSAQNQLFHKNPMQINVC